MKLVHGGRREERLKNAPGFDAGTFPDWNDQAYRKQVHDYYGSRAGWYV